jgi:ribose transport system ATP-binding protein
MREASLDTIIEAMVGRSVEAMFPRLPHERGEPILELDTLCGRVAPRDARLTLHRGEILGVAGLVGAGRTETLRAVFGLDEVRSGRVRLLTVGDVTRAPPARRIQYGMGLLSENRKEEGLLLNLSIADNVTLSDLGSLSRRGCISRRRQREAVARALAPLSVKARGAAQAVESLSGGNQQKVALARLLHQDADVLLLDEPTRGIDVGSKVQIYEIMGRLAQQGKAILFVSSYLPEILGISDRVAVMNRGLLSDVLAVDQLDEETIMRMATLASSDDAAAAAAAAAAQPAPQPTGRSTLT